MVGTVGAAARALLGTALLADVIWEEARTGFTPAAWILAGAAVPVLAAGQWLLARRFPARLSATGPLGHLVNGLVFAALYLTWWYAPPLGFTSDGVLIFYGASMLVAALRGQAGCEVLAVSNWLLRRDDQVGCLVFAPIDAAERRLRAPS